LEIGALILTTLIVFLRLILALSKYLESVKKIFFFFDIRRQESRPGKLVR
jgi:hypothetical protein